jgi:hypothetical protein
MRTVLFAHICSANGTVPVAPKATGKQFESAAIRDTIEKTEDGGDALMDIIGKLDLEKYRVVSQNIKTDEVVITDERIQHIQERHPNDFERYSRYIGEMLENPQYILEDRVPNTAVVLNEFAEAGEHFRLILKIAVLEDSSEKKKSIITFLKISDKKFRKYIRNKKILYKFE